VIAVDSSVLVAVINNEPEALGLRLLLDNNDCVFGAPTLLETRIWCAANLPDRASRWLEDLISQPWIAVVPFTRAMADSAQVAFAKFGRRSGHRARLNFGDCMAYAVAIMSQAPLLFKGGDFALTDVIPHPASVRSGR
jgi:ribonuclease VapC